MKNKIFKEKYMNFRLYFIEILIAGIIVFIALKIERLAFIEHLSKWSRRGIVIIFILFSVFLFHFILKFFEEKILQKRKENK